jgi:hypothetical protein
LTEEANIKKIVEKMATEIDGSKIIKVEAEIENILTKYNVTDLEAVLIFHKRTEDLLKSKEILLRIHMLLEKTRARNMTK